MRGKWNRVREEERKESKNIMRISFVNSRLMWCSFNDDNSFVWLNIWFDEPRKTELDSWSRFCGPISTFIRNLLWIVSYTSDQYIQPTYVICMRFVIFQLIWQFNAEIMFVQFSYTHWQVEMYRTQWTGAHTPHRKTEFYWKYLE